MVNQIILLPLYQINNKAMQTTKNFPKGFISWAETHAEICMAIGAKLESNELTGKVKSIQEAEGRCGHWGLAYGLTDKFETEYQNVEFGADHDFFDCLNNFLDEQL